MITFVTRQEADDSVGENETVCGTLLASGAPAYFVMPVASSDDEMRDAAFEVRNGRAMSQIERTTLDLAEARAGI